jgi:hypothetical protein
MFQRIRYFLRELNWLALSAVALGAVSILLAIFSTDFALTIATGLAGIVCAVLAKDS